MELANLVRGVGQSMGHTAAGHTCWYRWRRIERVRGHPRLQGGTALPAAWACGEVSSLFGDTEQLAVAEMSYSWCAVQPCAVARQHTQVCARSHPFSASW